MYSLRLEIWDECKALIAEQANLKNMDARAQHVLDHGGLPGTFWSLGQNLRA